jgi:hypothetical protein
MTRRLAAPFAALVLFMSAASSALADPPQPVPTAPAASAPAPAPKEASRGVAVLALAGATEAAWPLAQKLYGTPELRPAALDEVHARTLAGEAPPAGSAQELLDLAETRAAVKGDDAPSRQLLASIAAKLHVRALVVVSATPEGPRARVFVAELGAFDAASYQPDEGTPLAWSGAARSLARAYAPPPAKPATVPAPAASVKKVPPQRPTETSKKFYESGWFWGAIGAAAFAGGAVFFATRDNEPGSIHLQMQVPR